MEEHLFYKVSNALYQALLCNICFTLTNPLLFLFILFFSEQDGVFFLSIALMLTLLPSISALIYCVHQLGLGMHGSIVSLYLGHFKKMFFKSLPYSIVLSIISFSMIYSHLFRFILPEILMLIASFSGLLVLGLLVNFAYFLAFNPEEKTSVIFSFALYYSLKKWYRTLFTVVIFVLFFLSLFFIPILGWLIIPVFFAGFIYLNCRSLTKNFLDAK